MVEAASEIVCQMNQEIKTLLEKNNRNIFIFAQARKDLVKIAVTITRSAKVSNFRQTEAEVVFGMKDSDMPGLMLKLSETLNLVLNGKIDRIDTFEKDGHKSVAVYDYKLSDKNFDWVKFYYGLELQLACYLLIAAENYAGGDYSPAGMFFMETRPAPIKQKDTTIPDNVLDGIEDNDIDMASGIKPSGIMEQDFIKDFDGSIDGSSKIFKGVKINKDGTISGNNTIKTEELSAVLEYAKQILSVTALEISGGKIDVLPFRLKNDTPCGQCPFDSVCQFDKTLNQYREMSNRDQNEIKRLIIEKNTPTN